MLTKSYNENKYFFKNEKKEQYFIPNWLQLPQGGTYALSDSYGKQVFNKSQVEKDIAIILSEEHEEDEMEM